MNDLILYLFEVSISLALFYSLYWIFLKKETFFAINRFFLISSVLFSFIVPFINASFLNISSPIVSRQFIEKAYISSQTASTQSHTLGIAGILWLIYFFGAGLFFLLFMYKLLKLFALIKKTGIQRFNGVKVVFMKKDLAPFSFFNIIFVNKSNTSDDDFQSIISHEMIHIRQYHSIDLIIMELLSIFQWFNPFVWPYKKSLKETHEYLADNAVIAQGCNAAKYQLLIFEQHVGVKLFEFANNFNHSQIKRRITMITKRKSKRWAKFKVLLILPVFSLLVLAFADSNTNREPDLAKQNDADKAMLTKEDSQGSIQAQDQEKTEEQKKKKEFAKQKALEEAKKIDMYIQELKTKYKATDDPEMKKKIKMKIADLDKQRKKLKGTQKVDIYETQKAAQIEVEALIKKYNATDDPEKKEKIKKKIEEIKKKDMEEAKKIDQYIKELKKKYEATDDPEKKKEIKKKILELQKKKK